MKVRVINIFSDKYNLARVYQPGEIVDFEEKRAEDIVTRHLGEYVEEAPKVETPEVEAPAAPAEPVEKKKSGRKPRQK